MKREELKKLGLTDEQIDAVMKENGIDIESEKAKTVKAETERDGFKTTLDDTQTELKKFDGLDVEAQKQSVLDLQSKYDTDTKALGDKLTAQAYTHDAEKYLSGVKFSSDLARKAALTEFEKQKFKQNGEKFLGADDWVKNMKESSPDAFMKDDGKQQQQIDVGIDMKDQNNQNKPVTTMNSALTDYYKTE